MSILADTNILLRSVEPLHPHHAVAVSAVHRLLAANTPVYFTLQNIAEFWNVATRSIANNRLGLSILSTLSEVEKIENLLTLLPDSPAPIQFTPTLEAVRLRKTKWHWAISACPLASEVFIPISNKLHDLGHPRPAFRCRTGQEGYSTKT